MKFVVAVLVGLLWGSAAAGLNAWIMKKAMEKNTNGALVAANSARMAVDLASLALVFLLREWLPFPYEFTLVGAAAALSLITIVFSFRLAGKK